MFSLFIAGLVALFSSFLAYSPAMFHGLAPWFDSLSNYPVHPTPSASPKAFVTWDWEEIPTTNLTANLSVLEIPTPPSPHFALDVDNEDVEQAVETPVSE